MSLHSYLQKQVKGWVQKEPLLLCVQNGRNNAWAQNCWAKQAPKRQKIFSQIPRRKSKSRTKLTAGLVARGEQEEVEEKSPLQLQVHWFHHAPENVHHAPDVTKCSENLFWSSASFTCQIGGWEHQASIWETSGRVNQDSSGRVAIGSPSRNIKYV